MPSSYMDQRICCGKFYWVFLAFMRRRQQLPGPKVRGARFLPHCADFSSGRFLHFKADCALFFFKHASFKPSDKRTTGSRFGTMTALFVAVFVSHFLLQCMDVESNPGPQYTERRDRAHTDTWTGFLSNNNGPLTSWLPSQTYPDRHFAANMHPTIPWYSGSVSRHGTQPAILQRDHSAALRELQEDVACLSENTNRQMNELKSRFSELTSSVADVQTWCQSQHTENSELKDSVNQLSTSTSHQLQGTREHQRRIDDNMTTLYDWCRSLQQENNTLRSEMARLTDHVRSQSMSPEQSQAGSATVSREDFSEILNWCQSIQAENEVLKEDVKYLSSTCDTLENQCGRLLDWNNYIDDKSVTMDKKLEKLEAGSRAHNIKFFNVFEGNSKNEGDCVRQVVQLLNRFYHSKVWTTDDVETARRVGPRKNSSHPRPLIATMHRWRDKIFVLRDQESRKEMADTLNIHVATDLTDSQYDILREEKLAGRKAFFYNGRLHYHNENRSHWSTKHSYREQKEEEEERHMSKERQQDRNHSEDKQNRSHYEDRQQDRNHSEDKQNRSHYEDRQQGSLFQEYREQKKHQERRNLANRLQQQEWTESEVSHEDAEPYGCDVEWQQSSHLPNAMPGHRDRRSEEPRHQFLDQKDKDEQNSYRKDQQGQSKAKVHTSTWGQTTEAHAQPFHEDARSTRWNYGPNHRCNQTPDISSSKETGNDPQNQIKENAVSLPNLYSMNEFPPLNRELPVRTASQRTAAKRLTSGQSIPHSPNPHSPGTCAPQAGNSTTMVPGDEMTASYTPLSSRMCESTSVPENVANASAQEGEHNDTEENMANTFTQETGCGDLNITHSNVYQLLTEDEMLVPVLTPPTLEAQHDDSQTLVKQVLNPWESTEDGHSSKPSSPDRQQEDSLPYDQTGKDASLTIEDEVTTATPVHRPVTRSKARCKQLHLTDSFLSSGSRSSRTGTKTQSPAASSPK